MQDANDTSIMRVMLPETYFSRKLVISLTISRNKNKRITISDEYRSTTQPFNTQTSHTYQTKSMLRMAAETAKSQQKIPQSAT